MTRVLDEPRRQLSRTVRLFQLWRNEREDPGPFYRELAARTVELLQSDFSLRPGQLVLDLGSGPGWYTDALRAAGATVIGLEYDPDELAVGHLPSGVVERALCRADAQAIPLATGSLDGVFCSNMLEHVPDATRVLDEIARIVRPGGWAYVSWTNWYSPWGGHDMSPYNLLGPERGSALYERRHGPPRKNRYGEGLFPVHIGETLRYVESMSDVELVLVEPRYWRSQRWICRIPGAREVLTWNCVLHLRIHGPDPSATNGSEASGG